MRTADHLKAIDDRLDRLDAKVDERFATIDVRFADVDKRFEQVDKRFEQVDKRFEQVDRRFDEQRAHANALYEASCSDFNNLYDFVKAQAERTDARLDQFQAETRIRFADLHSAIASLAPRIRGARRRR